MSDDNMITVPRELLVKAGAMAQSSRFIVGGKDLNGPVPQATVGNISSLVDDLRNKIDEYDKAVIDFVNLCKKSKKEVDCR